MEAKLKALKACKDPALERRSPSADLLAEDE
jgi:hypothetical protein